MAAEVNEKNEESLDATKEAKESKPSIWPQLLSATTAGMAASMQGGVYVFATRALPKLTEEVDPDMRLSKQEASWFAALYLACAICISPLGGILSNQIGRRLCFLICSFTCTIGWILIALSPNIPALFIGRFLTSVGSSGLWPNIGVHIAETVHCSLRGSLAAFQSLFVFLGMLIVLGLGYCFHDWRTIAWICMIPGCIHFIMIFFLHETPYWLMDHNRKEEAMKSLQFYRGKDCDISVEFNEILKQNAEKASKAKCWRSTIKRIASPAFGRPFKCVGVLLLIVNWGEYNNLLINMINIFKEAKSSIDPELAPVFVGCIQVLSALLSSFVMRRASTKLMFITCISVVIISDISLATFSYLKNSSDDVTYLEGLGWLPLLFVICIIAAQATGVYPSIQLLIGELFPSDIRSLSIGLTLSASLICATINILIYPYLIDNFKFFGTFYFYASTSCLALMWAVFSIPDNRGLTLAKVEEKMSGNKPQEEGI